MTDPPTTPSPIRVLLVEDALDQALLLQAMLGPSGLYEVTHTQDGMHGLELFRTEEFDVVITDLNLPGMDGFDLTRELKRRRPDVPVLAATGYSTRGYAESAYRSGVDALLVKPVDQDELLTQLRSLLPGRHPEPTRPPSILAVGARPGDVVAGCGGTLLFHRAQGHEVLIFILAAGDDDSGLTARASRAAAETLGARVILADPTGTDEDLTERQLLLGRIIKEVDPDVAYIPTAADQDAYRREAHRMCRTLLGDVQVVLAYGTATATLDFRPNFHKEVGAHIPRKLKAAEAFAANGTSPPELDPAFLEGTARYWGRFSSFGQVEPFQVISGGDRL